MMKQVSIRNNYTRQPTSKNIDSSLGNIDSKGGLKEMKSNGYMNDVSIRTDTFGNADYLPTHSRISTPLKK